MTLFSHSDPEKHQKVLEAIEAHVEKDNNKQEQSVEAVVDSTVIPEIQAVLDEVETELSQEASQELKKIIKSRLQKIKQLEGELAKEKDEIIDLEKRLKISNKNPW
jgi:hypothetical protein